MEPKKTKLEQEKFAFRFDPTINSENRILFRYPPVYPVPQPATVNSLSQQKDQNSSLCEEDEDYEVEPIIDPSTEEDFLKNF